MADSKENYLLDLESERLIVLDWKWIDITINSLKPSGKKIS